VPGLERFPREERLTQKRQFMDIYEHGDKWVNAHFVCYAVRRAGQRRKMGLSVSRKVGGAIVRNRVKRYIREVYRTHRAQLRDDVQLVIVARHVSARLEYHECEASIRDLFRKGDMLHG